MSIAWLQRTELLIGAEAIAKLQQARIMVVGLGGIGSYAAEFLGRAGVGKLIIVDGDVVEQSNINRQLPALHSTIGQSKAALMAQRLSDINPAVELQVLEHFITPDDSYDLVPPDTHYVLDCIDSVKPKLRLIKACVQKRVPIISAMGAGGKTDPAAVQVAWLHRTRDCKFAQQVRKGLKREKVPLWKVLAVYSDELQPREALQMTEGNRYKKSFYGTVSYMPALFGLRMAAEVIRRILQKEAAELG